MQEFVKNKSNFKSNLNEIDSKLNINCTETELKLNQNELKNSYIFYRSFYESIQNLPKNKRLDLYDAICELALNDNELELSGVQKTIFTLIKPQIQANNKRYINGKKGGAPLGNCNAKKATKKQPKNNQSTIEKQPNKNVNENVNENENENGVGCFSPTLPPTLDEIILYALEKKIDDNSYCEKFYNYYKSVGWVNGKGQKIVDWQSVFNNWVNEDKKDQKVYYQVGSTKGLPKL